MIERTLEEELTKARLNYDNTVKIIRFRHKVRAMTVAERVRLMENKTGIQDISGKLAIERIWNITSGKDRIEMMKIMLAKAPVVVCRIADHHGFSLSNLKMVGPYYSIAVMVKFQDRERSILVQDDMKAKPIPELIEKIVKSFLPGVKKIEIVDKT